MDRERDCDSMQGKKHKIKLNRARHPPLNISTLLPPEILGIIFYWTMVFKQSYSKPPYNLLLVCRHWFEVALRTPQLWTSWGNSLEDWERRCTFPVGSGLNLKLTEPCGYRSASPSEPLLDALQDRAVRDLIQRVSFKRLKRQESDLFNSIIPAITTSGEGIQSTRLRSFELYTRRHCYDTVNLTDFFSRYRFPKLQRLLLFGRFKLLSWDSLASRTGALINLSLGAYDGWPLPTASELLSILSSNPNLQRFTLYREAYPNLDNHESSFQVELPHLEWIDLSGNSRDVEQAETCREGRLPAPAIDLQYQTFRKPLRGSYGIIFCVEET